MQITVGELRKIIKEIAGDEPAGTKKFPTWDELSRKEQIASIYSDVFKEKHGIRPRWMDFESMTDEAAEAELERLYAEPSDFDDDEDWDDIPPGELVPTRPGAPPKVVVEPPDPYEDMDNDAPTKIPMKGGAEYDALSQKAKGVHSFRAGERAAAKNSYNRRIRRSG